MTTMRIAENIIYLRGLKKLTQTQLAEETTLNRSKIAAYETGKAIPPIEVLVTLAQYFNVTLDSLVLHDLEMEALDEQILEETGIVHRMEAFLEHYVINMAGVLGKEREAIEQEIEVIRKAIAAGGGH